jgi:type VI secretion system Hcp family effector
MADAFLKIDGIEGEATHIQFAGAIELMSWSWGVSQGMSSAGGGGGGAGKASIQALNITKVVDSASPDLLRYCATGQHIPRVSLTVVDPKAGDRAFLQLTLHDVIVDGVSVGHTSESAQGAVVENVSLVFRQVEYAYTPRTAEKEPAPAKSFAWDAVANAPFKEPAARKRSRDSKRAMPPESRGIDEVKMADLPVSSVNRGRTEPVQQITRYPHMDIVENQPVAPSQTFHVRVYTDAEKRADEDSEAIEIAAPISATEIDLQVWLVGTSEFEIPNPVQPFTIDVRNPSAVAETTFAVNIREAVPASASGTLSAHFSYHGRLCGRVSLEISIGHADASLLADHSHIDSGPESPRPGPIRVDPSAAEPDLTIQVTDPENTRQHLQLLVSSPHLPIPSNGVTFAWHVGQNTAQLIEAYTTKFMDQEVDAEDRLLDLKGAGLELWTATPSELKNTFWTVFDTGRLRTISIASDEPFIPWELMRPKRMRQSPGGAAGPQQLRPLGTEFTVARWFPRQADYSAAPQKLPLTRSLVVAPDYGPPPDPLPLPNAAAEAALVLQTVIGDAVTPATRQKVRNELNAGGRTLVHFVCHGKDDPASGVQAIFLRGGSLDSVQVNGMDNLPRAFACRPLVFLNACEVGRLTMSLVGVGGLAKAFIDAGAGGVIAALWSIKDGAAHQIARAFYDELKSNGRVRPAAFLQNVREKAYQQASAAKGEDTYAAYCFYGDPDAVAFLDGASQ